MAGKVTEEVEVEAKVGGAVSGEILPEIKFPELSPGQKILCSVVEVVTPGELWVREAERTADYWRTYNSLQTIYSVLPQETQASWSAGSCCAVKTKDQGWVRALVLSLEGDDVTLLYGDLGQVVTRSLQDLQPLSEEFMEEVFFCFRVKVAGIVPAGSCRGVTAAWSGEARAVMEENEHQNVLVEVNMTGLLVDSL